MNLIALLLLVACVCGDVVVELNDDNFSEELTRNEHSVVLFYAPWCGHCKRFKPEFEKAAEELIRLETPVNTASVDCTNAGQKTCEKYELGGYPTLKLFRRAASVGNYDGARTSEDLVKYVRLMVGPGSTEVRSEEKLAKMLEDAKVVTVVGYFASETGLKKEFLEIANRKHDKAQFVHFQGDFPEKIVLYRPKYLDNYFDSGAVVYDGSGFDGFFARSYHGLVGHRKSDNKDDFGPPFLVVYFHVDYVRSPIMTNYWRNRVAKVAKNYTGRLSFAFSAKDEFSNELVELGGDFSTRNDPVVVAVLEDNKKYVMIEDFSVTNLDVFVSDLLEGKLEAYLKSQPVPEINDGAVKVAVANNFNEVVVDNGKDTLIKFYAPWCGYCKKLAGIYEELGKKLVGEDVVLAKMDAIANDVPDGFKLRGYPAIYWLPRESKDDPIEYVGGRTVDDFLEYVARYSTDGLKGYDRDGVPKEQQGEL